MNTTIRMTYRLARRLVIAVVGSTVLIVGIVMIVTPGPALIVIPLGLGILAAEFAWARIFLKRVRRHISEQLADSRANNAEKHRHQNR